MSVTLRCDFCGQEIDARDTRKSKDWRWADFPTGDSRYTFGPISIYRETKCPECAHAEEQAAANARAQALASRKQAQEQMRGR